MTHRKTVKKAYRSPEHSAEFPVQVIPWTIDKKIVDSWEKFLSKSVRTSVLCRSDIKERPVGTRYSLFRGLTEKEFEEVKAKHLLIENDFLFTNPQFITQNSRLKTKSKINTVST